ncbi:hypothetical protein BAMA_06470 [Bacillus manliponensis]|uniref:Uncharacterized protein n=1 Tax=Bacillus manliponensis TaxID=574376 RepID=A0A073K7F6_9BACI|nr:hypothetical protein [Bacillus manliponensis]KEK18203.1 hypothetical protein BAMA_06470 [Bacillus manliponensis]
MKNHYLLGVYKGATSEIHLDERITDFHFHCMKREIQINDNSRYTLLLAEIDTHLNVGMTDQFHLFTKKLQTLPINEHCYFIYDYKTRKQVAEPSQLCFPLIKIETSVFKLENIIQTMKDVKYPMFVGFKVSQTNSLSSIVMEITLSSQLLGILHTNKALSYNELKDDAEYLYLQTMTSLLSKKEITNKVLSSNLLQTTSSVNYM